MNSEIQKYKYNQFRDKQSIKKLKNEDDEGKAYELLNYAEQQHQPPLMPRLRNSKQKSPTYGARPIIMAPLNIGDGKFKVQLRNTENAKSKKIVF